VQILLYLDFSEFCYLFLVSTSHKKKSRLMNKQINIDAKQIIVSLVIQDNNKYQSDNKIQDKYS